MIRETSSELSKDLSGWCQSYVAAFSGYDASGIIAHWAFPALILNEGARIVFKSADQFLRNTDMLLSFYERQGIARAERRLLACFEMSASAASMRVHDVMLDRESSVIAEWEASYLLQRIDGAWKAVFAVADGEAAVWKALGTPLGV